MIDEVPTFRDNRGVLVPISFEELSFTPKRIFYIRDVPKMTTRGQHAHYKNKQYLFCLKGSIEVVLYDGVSHESNILKANEMIFVDKMIWDIQTYLTGEEILLSLCSEEYDKKDYITNLEQYEKVTRGLE